MKVQKLKENKGITLVALVITIVILLILATISIQTLTQTGLFESANKAKLEIKRGQISETLGLKTMLEQSNNPGGTAEEIITATRNNVIQNKNELEKIGKDEKIELSNEEKTERNAGYLVVSQSGGGMLRQGTRKGIRRTPANRGMRAHRIVKSLDISEDVCHGLCP